MHGTEPAGTDCAQTQVRLRKPNGFTLLELLSVMVIIAIGSTMALSMSRRATDSALIKQAISEVLQLQTRIDEFAMTRDRLPTSLSELGGGFLQDPWGNAYEYLPFTPEVMAQARKDRFLVPINTMYDLYSRGRDGLTHRGVNRPEAIDDVIRANDGGFIGLAINF